MYVLGLLKLRKAELVEIDRWL